MYSFTSRLGLGSNISLIFSSSSSRFFNALSALSSPFSSRNQCLSKMYTFLLSPEFLAMPTSISFKQISIFHLKNNQSNWTTAVTALLNCSFVNAILWIHWEYAEMLIGRIKRGWSSSELRVSFGITAPRSLQFSFPLVANSLSSHRLMTQPRFLHQMAASFSFSTP